MSAIKIEIPSGLLSECSLDELQRLAKEAFYMRLYQTGKISSGHSGAVLGMSRSDFFDLLSRFGVSYFDEQTDLAEDLRNAQHANS